MPKWMLVREEPDQPAQEYAWNPAIQNKLKMDPDDVETLEAGYVVWHGDVAYSLEEVEEVGT